MSFNILLIGAGQLGSRHLQALANLEDDFEIYVVEPSKFSLEVTCQRYAEVRKENSPRVHYNKSIEELDGMSFSVAIVATSAAIRFEIVRQITQHLKVQYLVLEKVLFQSREQLELAQSLLADAGINTWVNCPRRQYVAYQELVRRYSSCESVSLQVIGANWGLGCNAIHFIDLWHNFTGFNEYQLEFLPAMKVIDSKRSGYKELIGTLTAEACQGHHKLKLTCSETQDGVPSFSIIAEFDNQIVELSESEGLVKWLDEKGTVKEEGPLQVLYQSQLTDKVVQSLIENSDCALTKLDDSAMLHAEFLDKSSELFTNNFGLKNKIVPIT